MTHTHTHLPDVRSPEALRYAAEVLKDHLTLPSPASLLRKAERLEREEADRIEREQAAEAARTAVIERAARAIIWPQQGVNWKDADPRDRNDAKIIARCLFDAGLLNVDGAVGA